MASITVKQKQQQQQYKTKRNQETIDEQRI